ncbi:MAG: hypothetical protein AB7U63_20160, partial [Porticoccaceae bacterium]
IKMAVGDVVSGLSSVASGGYLDIQPPVNNEWIITNIFHEADVELYFYDGVNLLKFDSDPAGGVWYNLGIPVTNSRYIRVKNTNAAAKLIGYGGIVSKSA